MPLFYPITVLVFALYLLIVWLLSKLLHLAGTNLLVFDLALLIIGIGAAITTILLLRHRRKKARTSDSTKNRQSEIAFLIREANARLAKAPQLRGARRRLSDLPVVLFLGERGSAKTSIIANSGLEPELVAGQVYQDDQIIATPLMNLWLASSMILIEATSELAGDSSDLARLLKLVRGRNPLHFLAGRRQPSRAIVLCCDCEGFTAADGSDTAATARRYHGILEEIALIWGSRVPVYVMLTKIDKIGAANRSPRPFFSDYVRFFTAQEASQAFGVTVPIGLHKTTGVYNEEQSRYLSQAFDSLFASLADKRLEYLKRENDTQRLPNIYEFPREFRKVRDNLVRFLLDVGRPSQLHATPYLRGFYFTGVRPIVVNTPDSAEAPVLNNRFMDDADATVVFSSARPPATAVSSREQSGIRRVAEWVFLRQFFGKLIIGDAPARTVSTRNTRAASVRRLAYIGMSSAALIWLAGMTVSYFNNRNLIRQVHDSARVLAAMSTPKGAISQDNLRELDRLRLLAAEVTKNQQQKPSLSFRWGIYPGRALYNEARARYCESFERLLLADSRESLESFLHGLPAAPGPGDDYELPFRYLKAYLLITTEGARTDPDFLAKALSERWTTRSTASPELLANIQDHFGFFAGERRQSWCASTADPIAVANARRYLLGFQPLEQVYSNILADVSRQGSSVKFEDPAGAVVAPVEVKFPYTKAAWSQMQDSIRNAVQYLSLDPWVLGNDQSVSAAVLGLQEKLKQRYLADYIGKWHDFFAAASVSSYSNLADAARKLDAMTSTQSSILKLFCTIAANTDVDSAEIKKEFEPIQTLEPPATCSAKLNDKATQQYLQELTRLQIQVADLAKLPDQTNAALDSTSAKFAARTTTQMLNLSVPAGELLLKPILNAEAVVGNAGPQALNGKGSDFCRATANIFGSFPFKRDSERDVRIEDFIRVFQPASGLLAKFEQENLADLAVYDGARFAAKSGAKYRLNSNFLDFLNRAAAIRSAFFPNNSNQVKLNYYVQAHESTSISEFVLEIDGKTIRGTRGSGPPQEFTWNGESSKVRLDARVTAPLEVSGPWALFRFLTQANTIPTNGQNLFDYYLSSQLGRGTRTTTPSGILRLEVDSPSARGIFSRIFGLECVSRIAQQP